MFKKIIITVIGLGIIVAIIFGVKAMQIKALMSGGAFQMPPVAVTSAQVTEESWKQTLDAVGSLIAVQGVVVSTEVAGVITKIHFESGEKVERGQLLVEMDTSTEAAQLAAAEANLQLAKVSLDRVKKLRSSNTVAQAELDSAEATFLSATAQVENFKSVITKKKISAPFSGRLGIREVDIGRFINNGARIVSLQALDPIFVDFAFPQQWVSKVDVGMKVELQVDSYPGEVFSGKVAAITPEINVTTRTLNLRAILDNPDGRLLPGMFTQVSVVLPGEEAFSVVPGTAILYNSYGNSIFVINEKDGQKIVEQQFVRIGETKGDYVAISGGPKIGSEVVSTGVFKLRHGVPIVTNNGLAPDAKKNPNPSDS